MGHNNKIHIGFNFHVNFHHAELGDTNDENGFGNDLMAIRNILGILGKANNEGQPVRATWDFENEYTLGRMLPSLGPDVIEQVKGRIRERRDELLFTGSRGEIFAAMTGKEVRGAIRKAMTGSVEVVAESPEAANSPEQNRNVLGKPAPILCPEGFAFSPSIIGDLKKFGIKSVVLGNSAIGPDALTAVAGEIRKSPYTSYNPITYRHKNEYITIIPAYSPADVIDGGSLTKFVSDLRKGQEDGTIDGDIFILIRGDVGNPWWQPLGIRSFFGPVKGTEGLAGFLKELRVLDYIAYNTPGGYLSDHGPASEISYSGDVAGGKYGDLQCLGELPYERLIWTRLERARVCSKVYQMEKASVSLGKRVELITAPGFGEAVPAPYKEIIDAQLKLSDEIQSIEHKAVDDKEMSMRTSGRQRLNNSAAGKYLYSRRKDEEERNSFIIMNTSGEKVVSFQLLIEKGQCPKVSTLILECDECEINSYTALEMKSEEGFVTVVFVVMRFADPQDNYKIYYHFDRKDIPKDNHKPLIEVKEEDIPVFHAEGAMKRLLEAQGKIPKPEETVPEKTTNPAVTERIAAMNKAAESGKPGVMAQGASRDTIVVDSHSNKLRLIINGTGVEKGRIREVYFEDERIGDENFLSSYIKCDGNATSFEVEKVEDIETSGQGSGVQILGTIHARGEQSPGAYRMMFVKTPVLKSADGILVLMDVQYPTMRPGDEDKLEEVVPFQISPLYRAGVSVFRKSFTGDLGDFPVSCFGKTVRGNENLASFNNQLTGGIVGIKGALSGIMISHAKSVLGSMAMCPGRLMTDGEGQHLSLNPFGTYGSSKRKYLSMSEGLVQKYNDEVMRSKEISTAVSYNGVHEQFCMCLSAFYGAAINDNQLAELNAFSDGAVVCGDEYGVIHPYYGDNTTLPASQYEVPVKSARLSEPSDIKALKSELGKYINARMKENKR